MKNCNFVVTAIASALVVAGVSTASAQPNVLTANVPFEFSVGDKPLPRDVYRLSPATTAADALMLQGSRKGAMILVQRSSAHTASRTAKLIFHRYGNQYFLREVHFAGVAQMAIPRSRSERDAAERRVDRSVGEPSVVIVSVEPR